MSGFAQGYVLGADHHIHGVPAKDLLIELSLAPPSKKKRRRGRPRTKRT